MEYFDVVDEYDKPVGKLTTKIKAHTDGTLHRLVAVYVFDQAGKLLVQDHKISGLLDHSVGGHVSAGENYAVAAKREAEEELGLKGEKLEPVFLSLYSDEMFNMNVQTTSQMHQFGIFECYPSSTWRFEPNDEVEKIIPMDLETVVKQMHETPGQFTPGFINTMAKYLEVKRLPYSFDISDIRKRWRSSD